MLFCCCFDIGTIFKVIKFFFCLFSFSLVCAVSYTTQTGEKMYFRKFFKFQVLHEVFYSTSSKWVNLENPF